MDSSTFNALTSLTSLNLWGNPLTVISPSLFDGLISLTTLDLSSCRLTSLEPNTFQYQQNLLSLLLGGNEIEVIEDETFSGLINLERLNLISNKIIRLNSIAFNTMTNVKNLDFEYNRIDEIQRDFFMNFQNFDVNVDLRGNICISASFVISPDSDLSTFEDLQECYSYWDNPRTTPSTTEPPTTVADNHASAFLLSIPVLLFTVLIRFF